MANEATEVYHHNGRRFPFGYGCRRLAIREHIWDSYQQLHERLIKIENVLAETYFSQEQMTVFRNHVITQLSTAKPLEEQVIRLLVLKK